MFQQDILDLAYWNNRLKIAEAEILPDNFKKLKKDIKRLQDDEKKPRTIINHLIILMRFSKWLEKPYENVTEDDFNDYLDTLENLKNSSLKLHKIVIRVFIGIINPKLAGCIKTKNTQHSSITPDQLLTDEEIDCLIRHAPTARDKATNSLFNRLRSKEGRVIKYNHCRCKVRRIWMPFVAS